jgi:hypothetical protein
MGVTLSEKPTLAVDFDGVLHAYDSGWQGADVVADGPVPGAMQWLSDVSGRFDVCIYSSRSKEKGGVDAMRNAIIRWMTDEIATSGEYRADQYANRAAREFVALHLRFPTQKPAAFLTIDDRAICFQGSFEQLDPETLLAFKPWNKR